MKRNYVPGTYIEIPSKLLRYRSKFKQVGKNVFILVDGVHINPASIVKKLFADWTTLGDFAKKHKPSTTVGDAMKKEFGNPQYRRATAAEIVEYNNARNALQKFIDDTKAAVAKRKKAELERKLVPFDVAGKLPPADADPTGRPLYPDDIRVVVHRFQGTLG
jgi:hypothetical protein